MMAGDVAMRYTRVAMLLHWLIALGILALLVLGVVMTKAPLAAIDRFKLYQLHKSIGITVLLLAVFRVIWRLGHRAPPLPAAMPPLEKQAANGTHISLYLLMIGMPLSGWMMVSASPFNLPTVLYGLVPWPHLPILSTLQNKKPVEKILEVVHQWGAWILLAFLVLHIGAALRHHFIKRDDILARMLPEKIL